MGARCIFTWLRCFARLVGLYACNVRRLRTEKRNAAHFLGLLRSCYCFSWFVLWLLLCSCCLCWLCALLGLWVVLVAVLFPFGRYDKKKGRTVLVRPLFVRGLWACYMFRAAFIAASFDFEKIHPAPQVRCALNLPPRAFKVSLIARVSPTIARAFSE